MNRIRKLILLFLLLFVASLTFDCNQNGSNKTASSSNLENKVVINEAARTLLYLPLYHAKEAGFFSKNGLDVEIVTGGTATNSFAAMTSGQAQFSQADPMYVPISNEKGADTRVIAQVVSKIAVWGLTMNPNITAMNKKTLEGKIISTHIKPMTAYAYTEKTIRDLGLDPEKDVKILQNKPGSEITPMLLGQAQYAMTLEPSVAIAKSQGAKVIFSYPDALGDQIFTALMAKQDYIGKHQDVVLAVLKSYQEALNDIYANRNAALKTAQKYFPQLKPEIVAAALKHVLDEGVIPHSILMTNQSWDKAIAVRVKAGDLKKATPRDQNVRTDLIDKVLKDVKK